MTDRTEAIRARHAARLRTRALPPDWALVNEDMAVLLSELDHVQGVNDDQNHEIAECRVLEYKAQVERVEALEKKLRATDWDNPYVGHALAAAYLIRDALAPVAPDAEPTEWVWSLDDVVHGDGHVWHRVGDGSYPWASGTARDQRDQDITELVTKHGGRALVCKARGIGGAS